MKYNWIKTFAAVVLLLGSCKNRGDSKKDSDSPQVDDTTTYNYTPKPETGTFNNRADVEKEERQKIILMQIDSTYAAIDLLDDVKTEMTDLSPEGLTNRNGIKNQKPFSISILFKMN